MKLSQAFLNVWREKLVGTDLLAEKRRALSEIRVTAVGLNVQAGGDADVHSWWIDVHLGRRSIRLPLAEVNKVLGEYVKQCDLRDLIGDAPLSSDEQSRRGKALRRALADLLSGDATALVRRLSKNARSLQRHAVLGFVSASAQSDLVTEEEVINAWNQGMVNDVHAL